MPPVPFAVLQQSLQSAGPSPSTPAASVVSVPRVPAFLVVDPGTRNKWAK